MAWTVVFVDAFRAEFGELPEAVQDSLLAHARVLAEFGPTLGRPLVDTLAGTRHRNLKELRFGAENGVWRVAFAFDPRQQAVLLVAGDKRGKPRFYDRLIRIAESRLDAHLKQLKRTP